MKDHLWKNPYDIFIKTQTGNECATLIDVLCLFILYMVIKNGIQIRLITKKQAGQLKFHGASHKIYL